MLESRWELGWLAQVLRNWGLMASWPAAFAVVEFLQLSFHRYTSWPSQAGGLTFCFLFFCDIPIPFRQCQLTLHLYLGWIYQVQMRMKANCFICNTGTFHKGKKIHHHLTFYFYSNEFEGNSLGGPWADSPFHTTHSLDAAECGPVASPQEMEGGGESGRNSLLIISNYIIE